MAVTSWRCQFPTKFNKVAKIAEVSLTYAHLSFSATVRDIVEASHNGDFF